LWSGCEEILVPHGVRRITFAQFIDGGLEGSC
jgi:hypothetical protein